MDSNYLPIKICGGLNIFLGLLSIILQIVVMVRYDDEFEKIGVAIWCGLVFLLTGIIAVVAAHRVQSRLITSLWTIILIMTIVSILFAVVQIGVASKGIQLFRDACPTFIICQSRIAIDSTLIACAVGCILTSAVLFHKTRLQNQP